MEPEAMFKNDGQTLDYTPDSPKAAGEAVFEGGLASICVDAIAAGQLGARRVSGIIEIKKKQEHLSKGQVVGWDENGNPYLGTVGTGAATGLLTDADFRLGTVVQDAEADELAVKVLLNVFMPQALILEGFTFETLDDNKPIDIQDVGKAFFVTVKSKVITLPPIAEGLGPIAFINAGEDGEVDISIAPDDTQAAEDKIMGPDIAGADTKMLINTLATAKKGDYVIISEANADGWKIERMRGIWATET